MRYAYIRPFIDSAQSVLEHVLAVPVVPGEMRLSSSPLVSRGVTAIVACYQGLHTVGGTEGLGRATTVTVVVTALLILVSDFFLSKFFLLVFPPRVSL